MRPSILLVDDKKENLLALEGILDGMGWELCFASSGAEALRMLLSRDFAALVCDMHMPGMNGVELTRLVRSRERSRHAAILMLTASSGDSEELALAYAAGAVDFISKPVRPEVLIAKLRVFVELFEKTEQVRAQGEQLREVERRERLLELERIRQAGERRYQTLAHALPVIVWTADADGTPAYWNQRWYDYTGFRLGEDRTLAEALHPADREGYRIQWEKAIASGEPFEHEARLRRADGVYRWFLCRATPECGEAGVTAWIGTDTDIDDSRRIAAERETLLASERDARERAERAVRLREEFLQIASHELRTPLTSLSLALEQLRRVGKESPEALDQRLSLAKRQVVRLAQLVEGLLDVGRIARGGLELRRERFELTELAREVVSRFEQEVDRAGCEIALSLHPPALCDGDPERLDQVLSNLLTNALKYGSGKPVEVKVAPKDGAIELCVSDQGIGIAELDLERIFERFERAVPTTSYGGLGLGLYIARQIVEAHGGKLVAESALGRGATFRATLPRA